MKRKDGRMKIVIDGREVTLRESEVTIAKEAVNRFLTAMKEGAAQNNMPTLYVTILAVMHTKSTELLQAMDAEYFGEIMRLLENHK